MIENALRPDFTTLGKLGYFSTVESGLLDLTQRLSTSSKLVNAFTKPLNQFHTGMRKAGIIFHQRSRIHRLRRSSLCNLWIKVR